MDESEVDGRWTEPQGIPVGELVWLSPDTGGLQIHIATTAGKQVATIRKHAYVTGFNGHFSGLMWSKPLVGSVAELIAEKETAVKEFTDFRTPKAAVKYAVDRLPESACNDQRKTHQVTPLPATSWQYH
ncbi:hypothetical protein UNDKW_5955 (plasmid) [Undibacterium sp. KW1]|uniref:hypothetical protein n=1 Tax=Undibacterium sp. KW1 TaxID=2058624 RepID=UPI001331E8D4|nr:hypothetical protein [Undibacterium sp. KW1]BBB64228.1 hypothetical protein UNDKW_5955 [Undibacterium sp. KW1]